MPNSITEPKPAVLATSGKHKLIGQNYQTPDLIAKVQGKSKYAEDYRADGMLFCKLLLSPVPHGILRGIDLSAALAMPGVKAVITHDDLPPPAGPSFAVLFTHLPGDGANPTGKTLALPL